MTHSEPTKGFPKRSPEIAMLSAPFGCTNPSPHIPPFLLKLNSLVLRQYRSPFGEWKVRTYLQGHCRKWHHKTKVSCQIYLATSRKGLLCVQFLSCWKLTWIHVAYGGGCTVNFCCIGTLYILLLLLARTSCGWNFAQTTWPQNTQVQKLYGYLPCESHICRRHSMKICGIHYVQMELKLAILSISNMEFHGKFNVWKSI